MLCGETSPCTSELMLWAYEETKSFIICFDKYIKGTSAMNGGLSSAIKAVKFAVIYRSLLENQKLVLQPYLVKHICPCVEEILNTHIKHFKKVIAIFSVSDPWILEKYLVSGVFVGAGSSTLAVGEQHDYCLLTTSGRKVLTSSTSPFIFPTSPSACSSQTSTNPEKPKPKKNTYLVDDDYLKS